MFRCVSIGGENGTPAEEDYVWEGGRGCTGYIRGQKKQLTECPKSVLQAFGVMIER